MSASDIRSPQIVSDFDSEKKYPISIYDLAVGFILLVQGIAVVIFVLIPLPKEKREKLDNPN